MPAGVAMTAVAVAESNAVFSARVDTTPQDERLVLPPRSLASQS